VRLVHLLSQSGDLSGPGPVATLAANDGVPPLPRSQSRRAAVEKALETLSSKRIATLRSVAGAFSAASEAKDLAAIASGVAKDTLLWGYRDIETYQVLHNGPTHIPYYYSVIQWGRIDWSLFDSGNSATPRVIMQNFWIEVNSVQSSD